MCTGVCTGVCTSVCVCVLECELGYTALHRYARVCPLCVQACMGVLWYVQVCFGVWGCVWLCVGVCWCAQVYVGMNGCVWDEFSK